MTSDVATYRIVAIGGDGVGPDVVGAGRRVIDAIGPEFGFRVEWDERIVGGASIDAFGVPIRDADVEACVAADAVFLGACGGPKWDGVDPKIRPEQALFRLRKELGLFANVRPVTVPRALAHSSPLRPELLEAVDLLILRELTGGLYFGKPSEERTGADGSREAVDTMFYTEAEIRRIVRLGFELAQARPRKKLTSVDKQNVLATSRLWRKVVEEERANFPDVEVDHKLVDAAAMLLIKWPGAFDVIVTENLFGDVLSDEASVFAGSLGMLPSASIGARRTQYGLHGLYEPIHGSAPDIAGRDLANPIGTILSGAMLLRWSFGREDAARAIETAVEATLDAGVRTRDILAPGEADDPTAEAVSVVGTQGMAAAILDRLGAAAAIGAG
jgi:3-isopropylmalate dehydrogenase